MAKAKKITLVQWKHIDDGNDDEPSIMILDGEVDRDTCLHAICALFKEEDNGADLEDERVSYDPSDIEEQYYVWTSVRTIGIVERFKGTTIGFHAQPEPKL